MPFPANIDRCPKHSFHVSGSNTGTETRIIAFRYMPDSDQNRDRYIDEAIADIVDAYIKH